MSFEKPSDHPDIIPATKHPGATPATTNSADANRVSWFDDRYYKVLVPPNNHVDFYPSSTTILGAINKPWLNRWRADVGNEAADYRSKVAAIKGSAIHEYIHQLLMGQELEFAETIPQEQWLQVYNFTQWFESLQPEVLQAEHEVVSHKHRYAGTLDMLVKLKGGTYDTGWSKPVTIKSGIYVGDVKSGKSLSKEYNYQTASYLNAVVEMGEYKPIGTFIIHTAAETKRGWKMVVREGDEVVDDMRLFLSAKTIYEANGEDKPKVFDLPEKLSLYTEKKS